MTDKPIDDGGSAFPHLSDHCQRIDQDEMDPGLSIRDWFAGMALQGMLASAPDEITFHEMLDYPHDAWQIAGRMMKTRKQSQ